MQKGRGGGGGQGRECQELKKINTRILASAVLHWNLGCVRLILFWNRNTYNDVKKSVIRRFWNYWSTKWLLNYHVSTKVCRNFFSNLLKKRNLTAILLILIPEYGQWNATLTIRSNQPTFVECSASLKSPEQNYAFETFCLCLEKNWLLFLLHRYLSGLCKI